MGSKSGKRYTPKFKFTVVLEALKSDKSDAEVARAYEVHPVTVSRWKKQFLEKPNSWERIQQNKKLYPKENGNLKLITEFVLKQLEWYFREAAIEVLSTAIDAGLIADLEKMAKDKSEPESMKCEAAE